MDHRSGRGRGGRRRAPDGQHRRPLCTLSVPWDFVICREKEGICYSKYCSSETHGRIIMNPEWIKNNVTTYILMMINLCEKYHKDYMVGVQNYIGNDTELISRIKTHEVISRVIDCRVRYSLGLVTRTMMWTFLGWYLLFVMVSTCWWTLFLQTCLLI